MECRDLLARIDELFLHIAVLIENTALPKNPDTFVINTIETVFDTPSLQTRDSVFEHPVLGGLVIAGNRVPTLLFELQHLLLGNPLHFGIVKTRGHFDEPFWLAKLLEQTPS